MLGRSFDSAGLTHPNKACEDDSTRLLAVTRRMGKTRTLGFSTWAHRATVYLGFPTEKVSSIGPSNKAFFIFKSHPTHSPYTKPQKKKKKGRRKKEDLVVISTRNQLREKKL